MSEAIVVCDSVLYACKCSLEFGHEGPHICDPRVCKGSWDWEDGILKVYSLPASGMTPLGFGWLDDNL